MTTISAIPPGDFALRGRPGLILPGGGARAAYQVGVLKAIAELLPLKAPNPFPIISGTSAGAINATELACHADRFRVAVSNLERVWRNFHIDHVFAADTVSMLRAGVHWLLAMISGGLLLPPPKSLLDNSPLKELLEESFDFRDVRRSIDAGLVDSLAICASGYTSARSVAFFQSRTAIGSWARVQRAGQPDELSVDHLLASVAIPFLFPPVLMSNEYFGDGSMRQATPFSAAIHLGADRLLVIGTRHTGARRSPVLPAAPSFGQIFGYMLDALFTDGLYSDMERVTQVNQIVEQIGDDSVRDPHGRPLRHVGLLVILPSRDPSEIARKHVDALPRPLRVLLRTMGALNASGGQLMSYLMFEQAYTRELIALGYADAKEKSAQILGFLRGEHVVSTGATVVLKRLAGADDEGGSPAASEQKNRAQAE